MNRDFLDMLSELSAVRAEFLIVGAYALAAYGKPRATGDLDLWVRATPENAERVLAALKKFGAPLDDLKREDLCQPGTVFQIGVPPSRIDLLTSISAVRFEEAWPRKMEIDIEGLTVPILGKKDFVTNKRAVGRPQDLADLALLEE